MRNLAMIIHSFLWGALIHVIGSEDLTCRARTPAYVIEDLNKCVDNVFRFCTKAADDVKNMHADGIHTMKEKDCEDDVYYLDMADSNLGYLLVMEKYDYNADYYKYLPLYRHGYIGDMVKKFKAEDDYNQFRPLFCPNYTMQSCRALLTFCDVEEYAKMAFCKHPLHNSYIEYLRCYYTAGVAKSNCDMICDKAITMELFGIEKTEESKCKTGRTRCEDVQSISLIRECERNFNEKCDVRAPNTYSQCDEAIRSMKAPPELLSSILEKHKCNDPNSRLICFQYLKLLGEGKMASQFVHSQCVKQEKPEICNMLEEYCGNSNLTLPDDPPECKRQTDEMTTSTLAPLNQSSQSDTTTTPSENRKKEHHISPILLIAYLLLVLEIIC